MGTPVRNLDVDSLELARDGSFAKDVHGELSNVLVGWVVSDLMHHQQLTYPSGPFANAAGRLAIANAAAAMPACDRRPPAFALRASAGQAACREIALRLAVLPLAR